MSDQVETNTIQACYSVDAGNGLATLLAYCDDDLPPLPPDNPMTWRVNNIPNGSASVGTLLPVGLEATYTAPAQTPANNPVAVSVNFDWKSGATQLLVSNITVVGPGYQGNISYRSDQDLGGRYNSDANVIWKPDPDIILGSPTAQANGWTYSYLAEGSIDVTYTDLDAGCMASQSHFTVPRTDSKPAPYQEINYLFVDREVNPTAFIATGIFYVDLVITCSTLDGSYSYEEDNFQIAWSNVGSGLGGTVSANGSLQGNQTTLGIGTYLYDFSHVVP